jgi:uncharacterized protein (TIGR02452 family)
VPANGTGIPQFKLLHPVDWSVLVEVGPADMLRRAVLGAFGCGAFGNPADRVARLYREELSARACDFSVVAFAITAPGYCLDDYTPFAAAFAG